MKIWFVFGLLLVIIHVIDLYLELGIGINYITAIKGILSAYWMMQATEQMILLLLVLSLLMPLIVSFVKTLTNNQ